MNWAGSSPQFPSRSRVQPIAPLLFFFDGMHSLDDIFSLRRVHDAACTRVNDADLDVLEARLDSTISKLRRVKFLRLQLQKQELERLSSLAAKLPK